MDEIRRLIRLLRLYANDIFLPKSHNERHVRFGTVELREGEAYGETFESVYKGEITCSCWQGSVDMLLHVVSDMWLHGIREDNGSLRCWLFGHTYYYADEDNCGVCGMPYSWLPMEYEEGTPMLYVRLRRTVATFTTPIRDLYNAIRARLRRVDEDIPF